MNVRNTGFLVVVSALVLGTGLARAAGPNENYQSHLQRNDIPASVGSDGAESPMGRLEARKATIGGTVSPEARGLVLKEAARIQSKKAPTVGGAWTSIGPTNITRFQNGVNKAKDNSGRMRTILP